MKYPKGFALRPNDGYACDSCGDEKQPTIKFTNIRTEYLCYFCYCSIGHPDDPVSKRTMSQMMNALVKLIGNNLK